MDTRINRISIQSRTVFPEFWIRYLELKKVLKFCKALDKDSQQTLISLGTITLFKGEEATIAG